MLHVELIQNEWAAGRQLVVARVTLEDNGRLKFESADDDVWGPVAFRSFVDQATGDEVSPKEPERFIRALHEHLNGDYLFATEPHEGGCEYHLGQAIPLTSVSVDTAAAVH